MNINKDGKTLYFSDEEIDNTQDGEKKVFVTKRINGKESHVKAEKIKKNTPKNRKTSETDDEIFSFNDEFVIGVNANKKSREKKKRNKNYKKKNKRSFWQQLKRKKHLKEDGLDKETLEQNKKIKNKRKAKKIKKKKIKNKKPFIIVTSVITLFAAIAIFAFTAPIFNITQILVEGNNTVTQENIINLSGIKRGENIFRFNKTAIARIKENKYIQDVKIKRKLPGTVEIEVEERTVKYQLQLINSYVYIDRLGYILGIEDSKADVPVITGLSITEDKMMNLDVLEEQDKKELNKIAKIMESTKAIEIENLITEINIENKNNFVLYLESENKKVYIGDTGNLTNKMLYVKKILEKEKSKSGIIFVNGDISAGFKPYFREE